ncbi:helix-turn-helix domain-containing protein [Filimonas effusa]|uniref:AraC family transcriptional regulator n=1 Tax=Filimonas effusa TaxID=2508721 RepID=A0A4Q1DBS2_9BACT|nr:helix-turn-helix domain-containing protein [Filimonas effusa]RXK86892.1 AraC family transcriptional regulator [Filimonas effusa]
MPAKQKKPVIPFYHLHDIAAKRFMLIKLTHYHINTYGDQAHRDDSYIFFFQVSGWTKVNVDFREITLSGCSIFCVLPGQVHNGVLADDASAWTLAVDASYINETFRALLSGFAMRNAPIRLDASKSILFRESFQLLKNLEKSTGNDISGKALEAMLEVCISLFADTCGNESPPEETMLRPATITRQFKSLLLVSFRDMKKPSEYAAALNISPSYLNEMVKETTGRPVSYWIHQEIILEAKRMLFYTNVTVKEIAHLLGFNDVTYFIRLFTKTAGMSPLKFRSGYRK